MSQKGELKIGERVIVSSSQGSKAGVLRYLGTTEFAAGEWCGVELDEPIGKNDGSVNGKRCASFLSFLPSLFTSSEHTKETEEALPSLLSNTFVSPEYTAIVSSDKPPFENPQLPLGGDVLSFRADRVV